jgi:hypothetical protein
VVNLPQCNHGKARDQAADVVGVSGAMVTRAKAIERDDPEAFERIKAGGDVHKKKALVGKIPQAKDKTHDKVAKLH